jgi:hypothetical protein
MEGTKQRGGEGAERRLRGLDRDALFTEAAESIDQGAPADPEGAGGLGSVVLVFAEGLYDDSGLHVWQAPANRRQRTRRTSGMRQHIDTEALWFPALLARRRKPTVEVSHLFSPGA